METPFSGERQGRGVGGARYLCPTMVGREAELGHLREAWTDRAPVVVVRGTAGIGKSRLVREFTAWVRAGGGTVMSGRCAATSAGVPLRAIREALLGAERSGIRPRPDLAPFLPALGALVPDWAPEAAAVEPNMVVIAEGVLRFLGGVAAGSAGPTVLVVEDVHWADPETLAVLDYVADGCAERQVMVVVTARTGEEGAGAGWVGELLARRAADAIDLRSLDAGDIEAMVAGCVGEGVALGSLAERIAERSEGVPFFIEELVAAIAGVSIATGSVPDSIAGAVNQRLAAMSDPAADLVRHAAFLGRQFDHRIAAMATGHDPEDVSGLLREAVRAQLLDVDGFGFRFRHALTRDVIADGVLPPEREQAASRLLAAVRRLDPDLAGDHCQLAAQLAEQAGDVEAAAEWSLEAAKRAAAQGSLVTAEALAERAREVRPRDADVCLLFVLTLAGQPERVLDVGRRILAGPVDPTEAAEVCLTMARAAIAAGRWDDADGHLAAARAAAAVDPPLVARIEAAAAAVTMGREDADTALAQARRALHDAVVTGQPFVQCEALEVIGRAERGRDVAMAAKAFEQAHEIATDHGLAVWRIRAMQELGTIDMLLTLSAGRLERARAEALEAGAVATAALVDLQLAALYNERGEPDRALAAAGRCEESSRRFALSTLPMSLAQQAMAHARTGNRPAMDRAAAAARATGQDTQNVEISLWGNAIAVYHLGRCNPVDAAAALDHSMAGIRRLPGVAYPFPGLWALLRTVLGEGGHEAREEVRALPFDTPISRHLLAGADAVAAGRTGDRLGGEALFDGADMALGRYEGHFRQGLLRLLASPCAFRDGWGDPVKWLREAHATFATGTMANLTGAVRAALRAIGAPAPRASRDQRPAVSPGLAALGLTAREVEVLVELAAGHSNREIADSLVLSVRTVEKHVERILMKTGRTRTSVGDLAAHAHSTPR